MFSPRSAFVKVFSLTSYLIDEPTAEARWGTFLTAAAGLDIEGTAVLASIAFNKRDSQESATSVTSATGRSELSSFFDPQFPERNRKFALCLLLACIESRLLDPVGSFAAVLVLLCMLRLDDPRAVRSLKGIDSYLSVRAANRRQDIRTRVADAIRLPGQATGGSLESVVAIEEATGWLEELGEVKGAIVEFASGEITVERAVFFVQSLAKTTHVLPFLPDIQQLTAMAARASERGEITLCLPNEPEASELLRAALAGLDAGQPEHRYGDHCQLISLLERYYLMLIAYRLVKGELS